MRTRTTTLGASVLLLLAACGGVAEASWHGQAHERIAALHRRHHNHRELHRSRAEQSDVQPEAAVNETLIEKRAGTCSFPSSAGLVSVTPNQQNGGWAMSPDQPCKCGSYCPYACPPGQVSMQWNPSVSTYVYPGSMDGGLYCDNDGNVQKPFKDRPHCQDGLGTFRAKNSAGSSVSICQTVLPGNEAMLIPTEVSPGSTATLAVPGTSYWASTAAHYYVNSPGIEAARACTWGTHDNPWGNWSPYVAGANADDSGNTYTKIAWNPIWLEPTTPFRDTVPNFGIRLTCDGNCNGLPCAIDPSKNGVNEMEGASTVGVGGATFCVVTAPKGVNVYLEIFGGSSSGNSQQSSTSQTPTPTPSSTSVSSSSSSSESSSSSISSSSSSSTSSSPSAGLTAQPQLLFENSTSVSSAKLSASKATGAYRSTTSSAAAEQTSSTSSGEKVAAVSGGLAMGLGIFAFGLLF